MEIRLQKFMADVGIASRRRSEKIIAQGRVKVNGKTVREMGIKIDPQKDKVTVDGKECCKDVDLYYIVLNKPRGIISTAKDPLRRAKVTDLIKHIGGRIYPVGRLDRDTEGLLILTNDGDATYRLTHPKHEIEKTYILQVKGEIEPRSLMTLREGVVLKDGVTAPAKVKILKITPKSTSVEMKIHEGKNRQVRRMFEQVGHPVISLKRTEVGQIRLKGLRSGDWRFMTPQEINYINGL